MMASSARHLPLLAFVVAVLVAVAAAPRASADGWGAGRFFFSKTTRPQAAAAVDDQSAEKAATGTTAVPAVDAADPNAATAAFSRPSTGGSGGRGYGLYGRPEENFPANYFRRGVHRNAEKLTTTGTNVPATTTSADDEAVAVGGRGELVEDNGSGRGRAPWTYANNVPGTTSTEETAAVGGERVEPFEEDNGSGWGRPPKVYNLPDATGFRRPDQQRNNDFGMSDTRLYQNGRYYYDVNSGRYGFGRESNPVRTTRPDQEELAAGDRRARFYGNAAAGYYQYGNVNNELGNGVMENPSGFQEEGPNGRYIP